MQKITFLVVLLMAFTAVFSQDLQILATDVDSSMRGLSVVNDSVFWVSGSHGQVGRSVDAGRTFEWTNVAGYETVDFRDIHAFDTHSAVIMGVASPAYILKTTDDGHTWQKVYEKTDEMMFLDAMDFYDDNNGMIVGDALDGRLFMLKTKDRGGTWQTLKVKRRPEISEGEACFAASGTNIKLLSKNKYAVITGGKKSQLFYGNQALELTIVQGKETTGANGMAINDQGNLLIVGGDFMTPKDTICTTAFYDHNTHILHVAEKSTSGYRSGVTYVKDKIWIACGLTGVDITYDNGVHWQNISTTGFHTCAMARNGNIVYLAGAGKIGKITF